MVFQIQLLQIQIFNFKKLKAYAAVVYIPRFLKLGWNVWHYKYAISETLAYSYSEVFYYLLDLTVSVEIKLYFEQITIEPLLLIM